MSLNELKRKAVETLDARYAMTPAKSKPDTPNEKRKNSKIENTPASASAPISSPIAVDGKDSILYFPLQTGILDGVLEKVLGRQLTVNSPMAGSIFIDSYVRTVMEAHAIKKREVDPAVLVDGGDSDAVLDSKLTNKVVLLDNPVPVTELTQRRLNNASIRRREKAEVRDFRLRKFVGGRTCRKQSKASVEASTELQSHEKLVVDAENKETFEKRKRVRRHRTIPMSSKERKQSRLYDIRRDLACPTSTLTMKDGIHHYEPSKPAVLCCDFLPLHQLWTQYIGSIVWDALSSNEQSRVMAAMKTIDVHASSLLLSLVRQNVLEQRILKADLHGAIVTVVRSKFPGFVGCHGIILKETECQIEIGIVARTGMRSPAMIKDFFIEKPLCVMAIPKQYSVFDVSIPIISSLLLMSSSLSVEECPGQCLLTVRLYGSSLCFRASERAVKKFKSKVNNTVDL